MSQKQAFALAWAYKERGYNVRLSKEAGMWHVRAWR